MNAVSDVHIAIGACVCPCEQIGDKVQNESFNAATKSSKWKKSFI